MLGAARAALARGRTRIAHPAARPLSGDHADTALSARRCCTLARLVWLVLCAPKAADSRADSSHKDLCRSSALNPNPSQPTCLVQPEQRCRWVWQLQRLQQSRHARAPKLRRQWRWQPPTPPGPSPFSAFPWRPAKPVCVRYTLWLGCCLCLDTSGWLGTCRFAASALLKGKACAALCWLKPLIPEILDCSGDNQGGSICLVMQNMT